jgi:hypothetical protein
MRPVLGAAKRWDLWDLCDATEVTISPIGPISPIRPQHPKRVASRDDTPIRGADRIGLASEATLQGGHDLRNRLRGLAYLVCRSRNC